ncbi:MAG: thiolase family protein [Caulobacter sp.]|nr:thiolase family protein [Caulobacter sp.]
MSMTKRHSAAFAGFGQSRVFRGPEAPLGDLAVEASLAAIKDAGLDLSQIDGVVCTPDAPFSRGDSADGAEFVSASYMVKALGVDPRWTADVPGTIANSTLAAIRAVESGACNYALLFRALHNPGSGTYGHTEETKSGEIQMSGTDAHFAVEQFRASYGLYPPADGAALPWSQYQAKYNSGSREQMAALVMQARKNGLAYEGSYWAQYKPVDLTIGDYLGARMVSRPVCIFDCDIPVQGAGAFIITTAERARDLAQPPAYVHGIADGVPARRSVTVDEALEEQLAHNRDIGRRLWADAGCGPGDVSIANLYDGFSIMTIFWMEGLGLCGEGEAFDFIQAGRISPTGQLPINPSGGNLGSGRLHGINHLMDGMLQVAGRSGKRQVKGADLAVVAVGMGWAAGAFVLGKDPL